MTITIKDLGIIKKYNETDVEQTRKYIKLHSESYITKICKGHRWDIDTKTNTYLLPMNPDRTYLAS